jgi:hypothetical protein
MTTFLSLMISPIALKPLTPIDRASSAVSSSIDVAGPVHSPEAKLAKKGKGKEAKLAYTGNVLTENRNGFVVEAERRGADP